MPELADSFHKIVVVMRAVFYIVAVVCSLAAMALVPRRRYWWTWLGERTLSIYVTHVWVLSIAIQIFGVGALVAGVGSLYATIILCIVSLFLTCILAWRPLNDLFRKLLLSNYEFLRRRDRSALHG